MTSELAHVEESSLTLLPPAEAPTAAAVAMLREHAELMSMAYDLADKMCATKLVPTRFFRKPEDGTAAILYGIEIGLNPIQSLQRIIPIHGMPTLESLTMVALLEARGYTIKTVEETDTACEVHGWKPGRNPDVDAPDAKSRWTIERAIQAQYVPQPSSPDSLRRPNVDSDWVTVSKTWEGKTKVSVVGNMKYITDPQAMLVAKCQARVCKAIGSHVLLGIAASTEEMQSERFDDEPTPTRVESQRQEVKPVTAQDILGVSDPEPAPVAPKAARTRKPKAKPEAQDAEVVDVPPTPASESRPEPEPAQATSFAGLPEVGGGGGGEGQVTTESDLRKTGRAKLIGAIFSMFGAVGLGKDENREDRLIVVEAIVGRRVESTKDLTDEELQNLRNSLYGRTQAGTLDADVDDWLNEATIREVNAQEQAEAAAAEASTTTEGN